MKQAAPDQRSLIECRHLICAHVPAVLLHLGEVGLEEGEGLAQEAPDDNVHRRIPGISGEDGILVNACKG
jgi:hypothetical protein